jgi:release factor glutamine methyltransferase
MADIGAGSGAIACALAAARPAVQVFAVEASPAALAVAAKNVYALGLVRRVRLMRGDLVTPLAAQAGRLAMIVANLPYLASAVIPTLPREVRDFEPRAALDGGPDGLGLLRRLVTAAPAVLRPGGRLVLEIGEEQAGALASLMAAEGFTGIASRVDLRGIERYIAGTRP